MNSEFGLFIYDRYLEPGCFLRSTSPHPLISDSSSGHHTAPKVSFSDITAGALEAQDCDLVGFLIFKYLYVRA